MQSFKVWNKSVPNICLGDHEPMQESGPMSIYIYIYMQLGLRPGMGQRIKSVLPFPWTNRNCYLVRTAYPRGKSQNQISTNKWSQKLKPISDQTWITTNRTTLMVKYPIFPKDLEKPKQFGSKWFQRAITSMRSSFNFLRPANFEVAARR